MSALPGSREAVRDLLQSLSREFECLCDGHDELAKELERLHGEARISQSPRPGNDGCAQTQESPGGSVKALRWKYVIQLGEEDASRGLSSTYKDSSTSMLQASPHSAILSTPEEKGNDVVVQSEGEAEAVRDTDMRRQALASFVKKNTVGTQSLERPPGVRERSAQGGLPGDSFQLEAEDHYESVYDLTRAFHLVCGHGSSSIGAEELTKMNRNQQGTSDATGDEVDRERFTEAVLALNRELGIRNKDCEVVEEISLDTFIAIMQRKEVRVEEFCEKVSASVLQAISDMRDILVREDALRKVARATNMGYDEIYQAVKETLAPSRCDKLVFYLDPFIGFVIILNAIVIGVSTDYMQEDKLWQWFELMFTVVFILELLIKCCHRGCCQFLLGHDMCWNLFDTVVVCIAVLDVIFTFFGTLVNLRDLTMIRLLRFLRLTKLVRVLRLKVFKELALLVNGIFAGFRTLFWAVVFLGFLLFGLGVLLTQTFGLTEPGFWDSQCGDVELPNDEAQRACLVSTAHLKKYAPELFGSVRRSMFTVFRCFTDGCSSVDGTPLVPYFYNTHGLFPVVLYMVVSLFVMFGLFNLIMAVFVENTIENAKSDDARRREARNMEHLRVAKKLAEVIVMFCTSEFAPSQLAEAAGLGQQGYKWFRNFFSTRSAGTVMKEVTLRDCSRTLTNLNFQVSHSTFLKMLKKPEVGLLLDDLDIGMSNRESLFEVLDANQNGTLEVHELVQGLLKLRGSADKGDVIASLLAIRSVQKSIKAMEVLGLHQQEVMESMVTTQARVEGIMRSLNAKESWDTEPLESVSKTSVSSTQTYPGMNTMRADAARRRTVQSGRF